MKILIDDTPLETPAPFPRTFHEFCEQIMEVLLAQNLSIGTCEFDGTVVASLEEAHDLFGRSEVCRIASIPLTAALEAALQLKCEEGLRLEKQCEDLVTRSLLGEPREIAELWQSICQEIKAQVGFLPRLTGLLTDAEVDTLVDLQLKDLAKVMHSLHHAFNNADTLEISDTLELKLLPWLRQLRAYMESCLKLAKTLHR
jgi:hypothetical protein